MAVLIYINTTAENNTVGINTGVAVLIHINTTAENNSRY